MTKLFRNLFFLAFLFSCIASTSAQDYSVLGNTDGLSDAKVYYKLNKAYKNKETVRILDLSNQKIDEFPLKILELKNLNVLLLDSNQMESIPDEIGELKELIILSFSYNKLESIPSSIDKLYQLKSLYLDHNNLKQLSPEICRLSTLLKLNLSDNNIAVLPPDIHQLGLLEVFKISNNQIKEIPAEFKSLYSMRVLDVSSNKLTVLPSELFELSQLEYLYVDNNELVSIDDRIGNVKKLKVLYLSENKLTALPSSLFELFNVYILYIDENQIAELPVGISKMISLEYLDLSKNPFHTIPEEYKQLKKLNTLYLKDNQLTSFPQVLYDIQNNKTKVKGIKTKELFKVRILFSKARNKRLIKEYDESISRYHQILNLDTNNIQAMIELASTYLELNKFDSAQAICERGLRKDPPAEQLKELKTLHNYSANKTSEDKLILESYENNIDSAENKADSYFELGRYYFDKEDTDNAVKYFEEALKDDPNHINANFYYAATSLANKDEVAFNFSVLRFLILGENDNRTKTILPFLMLNFDMITGVEDSKGTTAYHDSYIVRNNEGEVVYAPEMPSTLLFIAMTSDLLRTDKFKVTAKGRKAKKMDTVKMLDSLLNRKKTNVEMLIQELTVLCKEENEDVDTSSFYYEFYVPYFKAMIKNDYLEAFAYLINEKRGEEQYIIDWLKANSVKVKDFKKWSDNYWP